MTSANPYAFAADIIGFAVGGVGTLLLLAALLSAESEMVVGALWMLLGSVTIFLYSAHLR